MPTKRFTCSLNNLEGISDFVVHCANTAGLSESEVYAVELAVDEASTNIIEHGYGQECPSRIDITCEPVEDGIKVVIFDDAAPFDPTSLPDPVINVSLEEVRPRGLGIYLMRKMMDEVCYETSPDKGNTLTMIKRHTR
jgi:anti-sigma regulatory factor (Ser/Thr protein kinase)